MRFVANLPDSYKDGIKMKLSILGSTGSIGTQSLDVARLHPEIEIEALTTNRRIDVLESQIREFKPKLAVVTSEDMARDLKVKVADTNTRVLAGRKSLIEAATLDTADTVLNSLVGMVGLDPTFHAIKAGKKIALANKETLVVGGELIMRTAKENGIEIKPVDSEHSAIYQSLMGNDKSGVKRLVLTASGGPFFGKSRDELQSVTAADALKHPNWDMGQKITIDSATMMNKGFEVIEAVHLFGVPADRVDVVVHRESIIQSMVEYVDNSVIAQLGVPDMRIPIQFALTDPARFESPVSQLNLAKIGNLSFYEPDLDTFGCLRICRDAIALSGVTPCAVNGANERAVDLFLHGKIGFLQIEEIAQKAYDKFRGEYNCIEDLLECDKEARRMVDEQYGVD